jgi:hypothetical protein
VDMELTGKETRGADNDGSNRSARPKTLRAGRPVAGAVGHVREALIGHVREALNPSSRIGGF